MAATWAWNPNRWNTWEISLSLIYERIYYRLSWKLRFSRFRTTKAGARSGRFGKTVTVTRTRWPRTTGARRSRTTRVGARTTTTRHGTTRQPQPSTTARNQLTWRKLKDSSQDNSNRRHDPVPKKTDFHRFSLLKQASLRGTINKRELQVKIDHKKVTRKSEKWRQESEKEIKLKCKTSYNGKLPRNSFLSWWLHF